MNLARCEKGHFFDGDEFNVCPHCGVPQQRDMETVAVNRDDTTTEVATSFTAAIKEAKEGTKSIDDSPTIGYFGKAIGSEPVVGWLVCIEGNHLGEDFRLKGGRNFIGRSAAMDVAITGDSSVARERHAAVIFDPKSTTYLVQPGEAKELCYLNDEVVLSAQELKVHDVISLGGTKLMFVPCCSEAFKWEVSNDSPDQTEE